MKERHVWYNVYFAFVWGAVDLVVPVIVVLVYQSVYTIVDGATKDTLAEKWNHLWLMLAIATAMICRNACQCRECFSKG